MRTQLSDLVSYRSLVRLAICFVFVLGAAKSYGQLTVTASNNATALATGLLGPNITVTNATMNCATNQAGTFNTAGGATANLGLGQGTIMTTGSIFNSVGPNNSGSSSTVTNTPGDPNLNIISTVNTFDGCRLEFDMEPVCDTVKIRFVFGSEEYDEWVCTVFQDAFGFFVSGPGITGTTNYAVVPGTAIPITIGTINNGNPNNPNCVPQNTQYYTNNNGGAFIQYDAFTVPMLANIPTIPCSTYHVKIAIADGTDRIYDSGVFLEDGLFTCVPSFYSMQEGVPNSPTGNMVEGCYSGQVIFTRTGDTINPKAFNYTIGGTAINGVDYDSLSGTINFAANNDTAILNIHGIIDGITEGLESIILYINDTNCQGVSVDTAYLYIDDAPEVDAGPIDSICIGQSTTIGVNGNPAFTYAWTPTTGVQNPSSNLTSVTPPNSGGNTYTVTVTDTNGCQQSDSVEIWAWALPTSAFTVTGPVCINVPSTITYTGNATVTPSFNWNFAGGAGIPGTGIGPHQVSWSGSGTKNVELSVVEHGCLGPTTIVPVTVTDPPILTLSKVDPSCTNSTNGTMSVAHTGGTPGFSYLWSNGGVQNNIAGLGPGFHWVEVTDAAGCVVIDSLPIVDPEPLTMTLDSSFTHCASPSPTGTVTAYPSGGTPPYSYLWNTQPPQFTQTASQLPVGVYTVTVTDANGCVAQGTVNVAKLPNPTVVAGPNVAFCEGEGGTGLTSSAFGGTPGYYWTWWCDSTNTWCGLDSVFDNDPHANPQTSAWYYVQVIDANGCPSNIDSLIVQVKPKPIVDAGPDKYVCADSAPCAILQPTITGAPGPFTYTWINGTGLNDSTVLNPCARPDTTTIYVLVVHSQGNGCTSEYTTTDTLSSVTVHVMPEPQAIAHLPASVIDLCYGDSETLQGVGHGAGPTYQYQWSPSTGLSNANIPNPVASPSQSTNYVLVTWSNGCPSVGDTVQVRVHTLPTTDAGPVVEVCQGEMGQLDGEGSGDPLSNGYTFFWWPSNGFVSPQTDENPWVAPQQTTTYYLMASSSFGCGGIVDSTQLVVKPTPLADAGENTIVCLDGGPVQLFANYYYLTNDTADPTQIFYTWSPSSTLDDSSKRNPWASPTVTTTYTLRVEYNTCSSEDEVLVTVMPEILAGIDADTTTICSGDSVQLYSWGGFGNPNYVWIPGVNMNDPNFQNPLASPSDTTNYQVVLVEGGCVDTVGLMVNVIPSPLPNLIHSTLEGCADHTVSFMENAADAEFFVWDFGDGSPISNEHNPSHTYTTPGTYHVSMIASNLGNCSAKNNDVTVTVLENPTAQFSTDPTVPSRLPLPNSVVNFFDESQLSASYVWDFGDGTSSNEQHPTHMYQTPGEYYITQYVMNTNGCLDSIILGPIVIAAPDLLIPNIFSPNGDGNNDRYVVRYTGDQPFDLAIYDRWGVEHYHGRDKNEGWDGMTADGKSANTGVYYYKLVIGDKEYAGDLTLVK